VARLSPVYETVARLRSLGVTAPVIGFPRGAGALLGRHARETGVAALGVDTQTPAAFARKEAPACMPLQGNLDLRLLITGGAALVDIIKSAG
jgi:uroporphyrinogen decarboxylase